MERDELPNHTTHLEDVQDFICKLECRGEKLRMKEATNKLASLVSSLNLGSEEMPIEE